MSSARKRSAPVHLNRFQSVANRPTLSKRLRFEVFKRDKFTCQYCGRKAPDVILHADHAHPRAEGGEDDILNLVTSCVECNLGKADKLLADDSVVALQRDQLASLEERREQIDMMLEWQRSLADFNEQVVAKLADRWCELVDWIALNDAGLAKMRKWIKKFGVEEVSEAMMAAVDGYVEREDGIAVIATAEFAFNKIGGICAVRRRERDKPYLKDLYYVRKIVENRCDWYRQDVATQLLESAFSWGADPEELTRLARIATSWTNWQNLTCDYIAELRTAAGEPSGEN